MSDRPGDPVPLSYEPEGRGMGELPPIPPWLRVLRLVLLLAVFAVLVLAVYVASRMANQS